MGKKKKQEIQNTHVPDKVYSYSLQESHAFYELLKAPKDSVVSIEVFEDVAIEEIDGFKKAIQIKSSQSNNNPISDRSVDLWKTFSNWILAVKSGELVSEKTVFKIFVAAQKNKHGNIANSFHNANNAIEASKAYLIAKLEFFNADGSSKKMAEHYEGYVNECFSDINKGIFLSIIEKFQLEVINKAHMTLLYETFVDDAYVSEAYVKNVFIHMLGWVRKSLSESFESQKNMSICRSDFKKELIAISNEIARPNVLIEMVEPPTEEEIETQIKRKRIFIEQLDAIECDYHEKLSAIKDYLKAATNRARWAESKLIVSSNFSKYEEDLLLEWNDEKARIRLTQKSLSKIEFGHLLYLKCKAKIIRYNNFEVPRFFVPGCYHALADEMSVGWHPEFEYIIKGGLKDG